MFWIHETRGFVPENHKFILATLYGNLDENYWKNDLFRIYMSCVVITRDPDPDGKQLASPEECKSYFLGELEHEMKTLVHYQNVRESIEFNRMKLEVLRRSVPGSPRLDQLLRYSASLERTFDRTLSQLERAQRMRLGQPVAPRIDVNVSSS